MGLKASTALRQVRAREACIYYRVPTWQGPTGAELPFCNQASVEVGAPPKERLTSLLVAHATSLLPLIQFQDGVAQAVWRVRPHLSHLSVHVV